MRELSTELRHNLFLATKEALNNIVKHAHATEAWIRVNLATQRGHLPSANAPTGEGMLTPQPSTITDWKY